MRSYARFNRALAERYYQWMKVQHYTNTTQKLYRAAIGNYLDFLGKRSAASVDHNHIREYMARISECGASLGVVYKNIGVLRVFYDFLNLGGVVSYVAPRFFKVRQPPLNMKLVLSESEVKQLISAARTPRELALIEFFYGTGCRLGEAKNLRVEDIEFDKKRARIRGKYGKIRDVLLTQSAVDALRNYTLSREEGFVFLSDWQPQRGNLYLNRGGGWISRWIANLGSGEERIRKWRYLGNTRTMSYAEAKEKHNALISSLNLVNPSAQKPISGYTLRLVVKRIAQRAGVSRVTPHALRRAFATHLYNRGARLDVLKALLGHVWISTTLKYAITSSDNLVANFERCHPRGRSRCQKFD
jgi:site-specific recombinase XerD